MVSRRSRRPRILASLLVGLLVLLVGIWLGGHPSWLPSPLRSAFVDQGEDPLVNQVLNLLQQDYYRPLNRGQLVNKGLSGMVASLDDPYSHYYNPSAYQGFLNEDDPHLSGIGVDVLGETKRAAGRGRVPGVARRTGRLAARGPDHRGRLHLAGPAIRRASARH